MIHISTPQQTRTVDHHSSRPRPLLALAVGAAALLWPALANAQVTERFIMTFQACTAGQCMPVNQTVYLAQSNDGVNWSLVPGFPAQNGSVPTAIRRGNILYYYFNLPKGAQVVVQKYHFDTQQWDSPLQVSLSDSQGYGSAVDTAAILDAQNNIVLFYTSTPVNVNYDPAGCPPGQTTCVQHFRMATENAGSDGTGFTAAASDVVSLPMGGPNQPDHAGDPFVFFDGAQYNLYQPSAVVNSQPSGQILSLYTNTSLGGSYTLSNALPGGVLIPNPGGIGSGFYNRALHQYWTYVYIPEPVTTIHMAVTTSLSQQITQNQFTVVASGSSLGLGSNTSIQHPHVVAVAPISSLADSHDFNSDGKSDILWRDTSGDIGMWLMNAASIAQAAGIANIPTVWSAVGQRDFDGDGKADILWQDTTGDVGMWLMNGTAIAQAAGIANVGTTWSVAGTGDFNGDGKGDILWHDNSGNVGIWLMNGTAIAQAAGVANVPAAWSIAGTGDFNGNGKTDILWIDTSGDVGVWFMNGTQIASASGIGQAPPGWSIVGTGDFNGDGTTDILWRDTAGDVGIWFMSNGQISSATGIGNVPNAWSVVETGDFNGDGMSDILWYNSGTVGMWLMNGSTISTATAVGTAAAVWSIQGAAAD